MPHLPSLVGFEFSGVMAEQRAAVSEPAPSSLEVLEAVQRRVLWLATSMVHHANRVRTTSSGVKVGGHEASSASLVGIMTALYFEHLRAPDRVSVKPHAAPVLHAINYLLGTLDRRYLTTLRQFGGLQSYPSRAKDPGVVDFSTGSARGRSGRHWSIPWSRASVRCSGSSTSTGNRSTGSCRTWRPAGCAGCSRLQAGRRSRSSTAGGCASCSCATAARRCASGSTP